jgi:PAS domain-containing protein
MAADLFAVTTEDGRLFKVNPAWWRILGLHRDDLLDRPYVHFIHAEDSLETSEFVSRLTRPAGTVVNRWKGANERFHAIEWSSGGSHPGNHYLVGRHLIGSCESCGTPGERANGDRQRARLIFLRYRLNIRS